MRFISCLLVVVLGALAPACLARLSFSRGCQPMDAQFYGEDKVGFYCMTESDDPFNYAYSTIELGHCLANHNGQLTGTEHGSYHESCEECALESVRESPEDNDGEDEGGNNLNGLGDEQDEDKGGRTCYIKCQCHNLDGERVEAEFDLNQVLENDDGRLVCFGHDGTREGIPPECHQNAECSEGDPRLSPGADGTSVPAAKSVV